MVPEPPGVRPLRIPDSFGVRPVRIWYSFIPAGMAVLTAGPCNMAGESGPERNEFGPQKTPEPEEPGSRGAGDVIDVTGGRMAFGVARGSPTPDVPDEPARNDCSNGFGSWSNLLPNEK